MSLDEAKNQVAKNHGFESWEKLQWKSPYLRIYEAADEAAQLFGDSQWNAALEKAAEIAVDTSFESLSDFNNFLEELSKLKKP